MLQLVNEDGIVTLVKENRPFEEALSSEGPGSSGYGA
jgi:hypothetical protein